MKLKNLSVLLFAFFTYGCASNYVVTYDSIPQGASLVCNGTNWGYTPTQLRYDASVRKQSTMRSDNCSANWISGARVSYPTELRVFPSAGTIVTVNRPRGDGYAQDAEFALRVQQMKTQQSVTEAAQINELTKGWYKGPETTYTNCYDTYLGVNCTSNTY